QIDLCLEQRNALHSLGDLERVGEVLNEGCALAESLEDQQRLGRALGHLTTLYGGLGEHARAIAVAQKGCAIAEAVGDLGLRIVANFHLGQALWWSGNPRLAAEPARAGIALTESAPPGERFGMAGLPAVMTRLLLAMALSEQGAFAQAIAAGEEGLRSAR